MINLLSVDAVEVGRYKRVRLIFGADGRQIVKHLLLSATAQAPADQLRDEAS